MSISKGVLAGLGAKYPESTILFDDTFENGFEGWQELHDANAGALQTYTPLGLTHPSIPGPCLALVTRSIADPAIMSQAVAMKRLGYWEPYSAALGIVDFEIWFAYGGESTTGFSPRYIQFMVDEMRGGTRNFWKARWRNVNESDVGSRPMNWYVSSAAEDTYVDTTYVSNLPWNGNKGSISRVKLSIDLKNRQYLSLEANQDTFNLASVGGVTPPGAGGGFDDPLFNNGLNFMVAVLNRGAQDYMGWCAITRIRASIRRAS